MTAELATAYVRLRPRTDGFKAEADAGLKRSTPSDVKVQVSADTRPADERLALLKDRLDTLRLRTTEARVQLAGDDRALGKLAALDAAMIRLDRARANPKIDLEGVAKAEAEIATLNAQLDRLGGRRAGGGAGGGGLLSRLAGAGSSGFFSHGLIASAVPLAGPLTGVAAGGAASLLTPTVAGTIGLGAFGFGAKASITQVDTEGDQLAKIRAKLAATPATVTTTSKPASAAQIDAAQLRLNAAEIRAAQAKGPAAQASAQASVISAQSSLTALQGRGGTTTKDNKEYQKLLKQEQDLLKSLDPAQRKAVVNIQHLDAAWVAYQKHLQPQTFAFLADGAKIAEKGLGLLLPVAQGVGNELDHLEKRADAALSQPFWHDFFTVFLAREAPHAIDTLGVSLGHIFDGLAHLSEKFAPLGHDLEGAMVRISGRFDRWTQGEGPGRFVNWLDRNGPVVEGAVVGIAHGIEGIATGLAPIGKIELQALTPVLEFIGTLGKEHPEVITALGAAYLSVAFGLKGIAAVKGLSGVVGVVKGIAGGKVGGGGGGVLGELGVQKVFVTNWPPGSFAPGGGSAGGAAGKDAATVGEEGAARGGKGIIGRAAEKIGVRGLARGALTLAGPLTDVALLAAGDSGKPLPPLSSVKSPWAALYSILDPKGHKEFPSADISGGRVNLGKAVGTLFTQGTPAQVAQLKEAAKIYPQIAAALKGYQSAVDTASDSIGREKSQLAALRVEIGRHDAAVAGAVASIKKMPGAYAQLVAQAKREGVSIGAALDAGITIGIVQNGGQVSIVSKKLVGDVLTTMHRRAELGSPSKITTQYGVWLAEGLAVGFVGASGKVLTAFSQTTDKILISLGVKMQAEIAKYQSDLAAKVSLRQSVQQQLAGTGDIGGATVFGGNSGPQGGVRGFLTAEAGGLRKLAVILGKLHKLGLSPILLAQIANAGPEQGVLLGQEILSGADGSIASLNRLETSIQTYANTAAGTVANAQFGRTLAHDLAAIATLAKSVEHLAAKSGRWNQADMHTFAETLAKALARILKIPLSDIDKALGIRSWAGS